LCPAEYASRETLSEAGGLVFDNGHGEAVHPNRVTLYERRLRKRLGMTGVRLHDLRHHAASAALNAGVPMLKVSRMLGHSRISTTVDLYGHEDDLSEATDAVGADIAYGDR